MFDRIVIHLTEPICSCEEQALSWSICQDRDRQSCLRIACRTCKTILIASNRTFVASFALERNYPGTPAPKATVLTTLPGGKIRD